MAEFLFFKLHLEKVQVMELGFMHPFPLPASCRECDVDWF